jgi:phytoene desaturase
VAKSVAVIGAGYAGMTAAALLSKYGFDVTVFEKNAYPGGRASQFKIDGFTFDKGPSFYWMPDVFDHLFSLFGKSTSDYYKLERLNPSYKVFWKDRVPTSLPANMEECKQLFESFEKGAAQKLEKFLSEAKLKYDTGMGKFVYLPSLSITEYFDWELIKSTTKLDLFVSISSHIKKYFSNPYLQQLLEFPVLFLGAKPSNTPALYSLMNYADIALGTWYPKGGMYEVSKAICNLGMDQGVTFVFNSAISSIQPESNKIRLGINQDQTKTFDIVVSGADYHHTESTLLEPVNTSYSPAYWDKKTLAPSALLYFMGFDCILPNLEHHSLFFDASFDIHAQEIYDQPAWPSDPLFYTNSSSLTEPACAPPGYHNMVALIPVSTNLTESDSIKERYLDIILSRLSRHTGIDCKKHLILVKSYAHRDYITDYNSFKGNAYGLANTLFQTGPLRPKIRSKKIPNLFYCGQLTVPGPGLPPSIISGEIVANYINKTYNG